MTVGNIFHIYEILGSWADATSTVFCSVLPSLCKFLEGFVITHDPKYDNTDRFQVYMGHYPCGASVQSMDHYAQMIGAG